ncbi:MAG TPA: DUF92 domain-containing protein [Gemmatimonadaceae bacterium]|nr:DUF92 domain-containing protein [Gemmatimonadaceae bacterium]
MIARTLAGFALAATIAVAARAARSLTTSGAIAATLVGTVAVAAGWGWGVLLIAYFVSSSALSHAGRAAKTLRTRSVVGKTGARDATQVLANGGVFALAALVGIVHHGAAWMAAGAGALAASAGDTWGTEIGTLYGGTPRSIVTLRRVPPGTSGGVSVIGTMSSILGACFVAALALALHWGTRAAAAALAGGVAGALADSVIGATLQVRRRCAACDVETERVRHDCGAPTVHARGIAWLDNDGVNLLATLAGALLAASLAASLAP